MQEGKLAAVNSPISRLQHSKSLHRSSNNNDGGHCWSSRKKIRHRFEQYSSSDPRDDSGRVRVAKKCVHGGNRERSTSTRNSTTVAATTTSHEISNANFQSLPRTTNSRKPSSRIVTTPVEKQKYFCFHATGALWPPGGGGSGFPSDPTNLVRQASIHELLFLPPPLLFLPPPLLPAPSCAPESPGTSKIDASSKTKCSPAAY